MRRWLPRARAGIPILRGLSDPRSMLSRRPRRSRRSGRWSFIATSLREPSAEAASRPMPRTQPGATRRRPDAAPASRRRVERADGIEVSPTNGGGRERRSRCGDGVRRWRVRRVVVGERHQQPHSGPRGHPALRRRGASGNGSAPVPRGAWRGRPERPRRPSLLPHRSSAAPSQPQLAAEQEAPINRPVREPEAAAIEPLRGRPGGRADREGLPPPTGDREDDRGIGYPEDRCLASAVGGPSGVFK